MSNTENETESKTLQTNMRKSNSKKLDNLIEDLKSKKICKVSHTVKLNKVLSDTIEDFVKVKEITKTDLFELILNDYFNIK